MGRDKTQLPIGNKTLLEHVLSQLRDNFKNVILSVKNKSNIDIEGIRIIPDDIPMKGPVVGLISCIRQSKTDINFAVACDIPNIDLTLVQTMLARAAGVDAVVPKTHDGHIEPLFAIYSKSALQAMQHVLDCERGQVSRVVAHCRTAYVALGPNTQLRNLNTMADYRTFIAD